MRIPISVVFWGVISRSINCKSGIAQPPISLMVLFNRILTICKPIPVNFILIFGNDHLAQVFIRLHYFAMESADTDFIFSSRQRRSSSISSQPGPCAKSTERFGYLGNKANLTSVLECGNITRFPIHFPAINASVFESRFNNTNYLIGSYDLVSLQVRGSGKGHHFNEPYLPIVFD